MAVRAGNLGGRLFGGVAPVTIPWHTFPGVTEQLQKHGVGVQSETY